MSLSVLITRTEEYKDYLSIRITKCWWHCFSCQYPGGKAERENRWEIPALLRLKIWFGLEKQEPEWHKMQTEGELAVFAETVRTIEANLF